MKPAATGRYEALADPPGPPRPYRVRLQVDVRIDVILPEAAGEADAQALARALWQARRDAPRSLAGFPVATSRLVGCEFVDRLD